MKVNEIHQGSIQGPSVRKGHAAGEGAGSFQEIMDRAIGQRPADRTPVHGAGTLPLLDGVQIVGGAGGAEASSLSGLAKERTLQEIQDTIDVIDRYAMNLGNPSLSTSDMKPLVEHLEGSLNGLRRMGEDTTLPEALRNVVSDLAVTIGTEAAKFRRGDYE